MSVLKDEVERAEVYMKRLGPQLKTLRVLEGKLKEDEIASAYASLWETELQVIPAKGTDARALALDVARALGSRKPVSKKFNESTGKIAYTVVAGKARVKIEGGDARCKVEPVTKSVWTEPTPGHYTERTTYKIVNPEECGANEGGK